MRHLEMWREFVLKLTNGLFFFRLVFWFYRIDNKVLTYYNKNDDDDDH